MWRGLLIAMLLAGCVQLPPRPQDMQAKRFEAVPGKAVIYLVRNNPDVSKLVATVKLDGVVMGSSYPGTYFRWEVSPGQHWIAGYASDTGEISLVTDAGKIYYVRQNVVNKNTPQSMFQVVSELDGRMIAIRGELARTQ